LSVLLIDDHTDTLWSLKRLLARHGYNVTTATSCADALACATEATFDVIVSDLGLPDGSGMDLIQKLHKTCSTPAIALSGYGMESDISETLEAGFKIHLTKPIVLQSLLRAIESLTSSAAAKATASPV
jgi:CheY-like chemotaxis protein